MNNKPIPKGQKIKLPKLKTVRTKADNLLTPIIKIEFPRCLLCNQPTQVAHHFIFKSKSTALRYVFDNLIPLCHKCHFRLHKDETQWSGKIIEIKGLQWFTNLQTAKNDLVKADVHYFIKA